MLIDDDLDGGKIAVVRPPERGRVELAIEPDNASFFAQWFHFRARGVAGVACELAFVNVDEVTYPDALDGYRLCASYDFERWFRVPTSFERGALVARHTPASDVVYYAYFAPYSRARHAGLLEAASSSRRAYVERLGASVDGRDINLIVVGDPADETKRVIWIIGRQHPGETMGEWFVDGVVRRLLDEGDDLSAALLERANFFLVPCMNPDGAVRGNHRTNAAGADLNREWGDPDEASSPEVYFVREKMLETGVDLFLDVHGDERDTHVFAAGCEGNPGYNERLDALEDLFMDSLIALSQDFQREYGYERDRPGEADMRAASNWVGEQFDCLSLTLEMPFKDNVNRPDNEAGWSPERAAFFGRCALEGVFVCLDSLR